METVADLEALATKLNPKVGAPRPLVRVPFVISPSAEIVCEAAVALGRDRQVRPGPRQSNAGPRAQGTQVPVPGPRCADSSSAGLARALRHLHRLAAEPCRGETLQA